jgi:CheY-like chemotaxis protein
VNYATAGPLALWGRLSGSNDVKENLSDPEALQKRIHELETLCAEVYVAAVELGFPQELLNRLWTVAAQGRTPGAFKVDMPPRPVLPPSAVPPPAAGAAERAMPATAANGAVAQPRRSAEGSQHRQIPDIKLTDRPFAPRQRDARTEGAELKPLAERRTVLVVDDDPMMLEVLTRILQRENLELLSATGGADALAQAAAHGGTIDLLITDYAMPDMKGRELADQMRARYPALRVLYQTGFSDMLFEDRVELEPAEAFVEKPFSARGLREAARFILFGAINPA